jgi:hypothetical protein
MKFDDIKVGDIVFTEEKVSYGWNYSENFWLPRKVERVTKTQFVIEGGDRFKKNGSKMGTYGVWAKFEGDNYGFSDSNKVSDQREEMDAFKRKIQAERNINNIIANIKVEANSDFDLKTLNTILASLEAVRAILNKEETT